MTPATYLSSLQDGLRRALVADERVILIGEDIVDPSGGSFKVTKGLSTHFPDRVLVTPISEPGIVGVAAGMALRGMRPVVEIMFGDFITLAVDQVVNHLAKIRGMYSADLAMPVVIRTPMGGGRGYGPTHSQSLEKLFLGIPHLRILAPSLYHDPGAMLFDSIMHTEDPVIFLEHKLLYSARPPEGCSVELLDERAGAPTAVVRNYEVGQPDVAVITYGGISAHLPALLARLATEEIRVTVCLPGSLQPLPIGLISATAAEAGRVVVVEDGTEGFGWSAEVAAQVYGRVGSRLQAPIQRLAAQPSVVPAAASLEQEMLVTPERIEAAIYEVLESK